MSAKRREEPTAFRRPRDPDEKLVLRICEVWNQFDREMLVDYMAQYADEIAQSHGCDVSYEALQRAAARLTRKGYLRQVSGVWYRAGDVLGVPDLDERTMPDVEFSIDHSSEEVEIGSPVESTILCPRLDDRVVVEYSGSAPRYTGGWDPEHMARERLPELSDPAAWASDAVEIMKNRASTRCLTVREVRTLLAGYAQDYMRVLEEQAQGECTRLIEDIAPGQMLTPHGWVRREMQRGVLKSPRLDRYRRYAMAMKGGAAVPEQVILSILREFMRSWVAVEERPAEGTDEGDWAAERMIARSLAEILYAAGVRPENLHDHIEPPEPARTLYRRGLRAFDLLGADDFEIEFGSDKAVDADADSED